MVIIAEQIKGRIEGYVQRFSREGTLLTKAQSGGVGQNAVDAYLVSVRYVLGQTPRHLELGRKLAWAQGKLKLADYLGQKLAEELGHEQWAEQDLQVLRRGKDPEEYGELASPLPAAVALMEFVEQSIRRDPALYVPYILFAEYFTVLMGPSWVSALSERCEIPREAMTAVDKHVLADAAHAAHGFAAAAELLQEADASLEVLEESMRLFRCFTEEVAAIH